MFFIKSNLLRKLRVVRRLPDTQRIIEKIPGLEEVGQILERIDIQHKFEEDKGDGIRQALPLLELF